MKDNILEQKRGNYKRKYRRIGCTEERVIAVSTAKGRTKYTKEFFMSPKVEMRVIDVTIRCCHQKENVAYI